MRKAISRPGCSITAVFLNRIGVSPRQSPLHDVTSLTLHRPQRDRLSRRRGSVSKPFVGPLTTSRPCVAIVQPKMSIEIIKAGKFWDGVYPTIPSTLPTGR